jgi:hypothetical protein
MLSPDQRISAVAAVRQLNKLGLNYTFNRTPAGTLRAILIERSDKTAVYDVPVRDERDGRFTVSLSLFDAKIDQCIYD